MRQSLRNHLLRDISRGRFSRLARLGAQALASHTRLPVPAALRGPILATFAITYRCPLRCAMCDLPSRASDEIAEEMLPRWIDAIAQLKPAGLGITGGEPLLRKTAVGLLAQSVNHGMVTHLNTSGLPVTEEIAGRIAGTGLASVNISVDHKDSDRHDDLRRRTGSFRAALDAVGHLARARDTVAPDLRVQVCMAVSRRTLEDVPDVEALVTNAGANALSLLPIHHFHEARPHEARRTAKGWPQKSTLPDALRGRHLENSRTYLSGIQPFLEGATTPGSCSAARTAVFIDPRGMLFPCTPAASTSDSGISSSPETLKSIVRSGALASIVPKNQCQRCWWNCHRELDIAMGLHPA